MFVAFSHTLTNEQIQDAKTSMGVTRIVTLKEVNPELQAQFSQVPPLYMTFQLKLLPEKGRTFYRKTLNGLPCAGTRHMARYGLSQWTVFVHEGEYVHECFPTSSTELVVKYSIRFPEGEGLPMNRFLFGGPMMLEFIRAKDRHIASLNR